MKNNIDLHLHTYYSDGSDSPAEVVKRASELGFQTICITDHDTTDGVAEALEAGKKYGVTVAPGIEFSAKCEMPDAFNAGKMKTYYMHILGIGIDPENKPLKAQLEIIRGQRAERNDAYIRWFRANGVDLTTDELKKYSPAGFIGKMSFAKALVERNLCKDVKDAFKDPRYLAHPEVKAIRRQKIEAATAIGLINEAGGLAFFAHPFQLKYDGYQMDSTRMYRQNLEMLIATLSAVNLSGIEAYYPTHDEESTGYLQGLADYLGLLISRGSDDHGKGIHSEKNMGGLICEPDPKKLIWTDVFNRL